MGKKKTQEEIIFEALESAERTAQRATALHSSLMAANLHILAKEALTIYAEAALSVGKLGNVLGVETRTV